MAGTADLKASEGFRRFGPCVLAVLGYAAAFYVLSVSLKQIPLGIAYAIWSGLGTVGSVLLGVLIWRESLGFAHLVGIGLIVVLGSKGKGGDEKGSISFRRLGG